LALQSDKCRQNNRYKLKKKLDKIISNPKIKDVFSYTLTKKRNKPYQIKYQINKEAVEGIEDELGFRIIMTNRHNWESEDIIKAYHGQSIVENSFKNIKNPFHISMRPNFHWTDQKIKVHAFSCVLGYSLSMLIWKIAREKAGYKGDLDNLLDTLNDIRLASIVTQDKSKTRGKINLKYQIEEVNDDEAKFIDALSICNSHKRKMKIEGISVYK